MCKPLLEYGVTSIIVENPFYGSRKPVNLFALSSICLNLNF